MPNDLALRPLAPTDPPRGPSRPHDPVGTGMPEAMSAPAPPVFPNPSLRIDGTLGLVVMEWRDVSGEITSTIPSPRVLAAYRAAVISDTPIPAGTPPLGDTPPPAAAPGGSDRSAAVSGAHDEAVSRRDT